MRLKWHNYKYYPYERQLALREAATLLGGSVTEVSDGIELGSINLAENAERLVYFSQIHHGRVTRDTVQARLEKAAHASRNRQATRYSVHGLHEYKGKFNPQIAKAILNIFGIRRGDHVLDPFCGSGTTLVECSQLGANATGYDVNPLAVYLANAKLKALITPFSDLQSKLIKLEKVLSKKVRACAATAYDARGIYLRDWFDDNNLKLIENLKMHIEEICGDDAPFFLITASNLLRDYSQQDPGDLRIRRRTSALPTLPLYEAFSASAKIAIGKLEEAQAILGVDLPRGQATLLDVTAVGDVPAAIRFDAAITSPPYAMALPYIDTQRLSLVWLGMVNPNEVLQLESELIGSREMRGGSRRLLTAHLADNGDNLPKEQYEYCKKLERAIGGDDGFRRKAVPPLLYRYFCSMRQSFAATRARLKPGAPYALIVGHNHTVLGGVRFDIDTPRHLAALAESAGWQIDELVELQTYRRYGYHSGNAVSAETLVLLRNP